MLCLANQRERDRTHTAHTAANTKQGIENNCNVQYMYIIGVLSQCKTIFDTNSIQIS
jgi:hypothetical protein